MQLEEKHAFPENLPAGKLIPTEGIQMGVVPVASQIVASVLGGAAVHYGPLGEETGYPACCCQKMEGRAGQCTLQCRWEIDSWSLVRQPIEN